MDIGVDIKERMVGTIEPDVDEQNNWKKEEYILMRELYRKLLE